MLALLLCTLASAQDILVEPFLQLATPTSVHITWETDVGDESVIDFGPGDRSATGTHVASGGGTVLHHVTLTGLTAGTVYEYQARTGAASSGVHRFKTPGDGDFTLVAVSDMQRAAQNPEKWGEVVNEGILPYLGGQPHETADAVVIPGDLVEDGLDYSQWAGHFFGPAKALFAEVPVYPVLGNHENNSPFYFDYFTLPDNGTPGYEEHWWWHDRGNVRLVGLDSNGTYITQAQVDWLIALLDDTCDDDGVDFVFAQLHHPYHSELWTPGNNPFTGRIIDELSAFSTRCGKPSVHFFGHTHAYSRGVSQDHQHLMVNVATAGGAIDYWGEQPQRNYPEFSVSTDDWGFVVLDVTQADPSFTLTRVSRGNVVPADNVVTDTLTVRRNNAPPAAPIPWGPKGDGVTAECFALTPGPFVDPESDGHQATQWQIAPTCDGFDNPTVDLWRQDRDLYMGEDLRQGLSLAQEHVTELAPGSWCWRARFRDSGFVWSDWSQPMAFQTVSVLERVCDEVWPEPEVEQPEGCGCASGGSAATWWLALPLLWLRRRR